MKNFKTFFEFLLVGALFIAILYILPPFILLSFIIASDYIYEKNIIKHNKNLQPKIELILKNDEFINLLQQCDNNDYFACNNLAYEFEKIAYLHNTYDYGDKYYQEALKNYEKACLGGFIVSCTNAGTLYGFSPDYPGIQGRLARCWSKKFYEKSEKYLKFSCEKSDYGACKDLGLLYRDCGKHYTQNYNKVARKYFDLACQNGINKACKTDINAIY